MIQINNKEEILPAYAKWLRIDDTVFWSMSNQSKPFIQKHVSPTKGLNCYKHNNMDCYEVPTSVSYPLSKRDAGIVLTENTWEILARNIQPNIQKFLMEYLSSKYPQAAISVGNKYNSNDIYINGKKVFGELSFTRAKQTYYACMINCNLTKNDEEAILQGLQDDKNFFPDKLKQISGIKNEIPSIDLEAMLETIEEYMFTLAKVPEYILY